MCATMYGWRHLVKATEVVESNPVYSRVDDLKSPVG